MTKEITKAFILQEMQDKFKLRELTPEIFRFSEEVVPTYDIEQHLKTWRNPYSAKTIISTGGMVFFTVPPNESWLLNGYVVVPMGAGAFTFAGVYYVRSVVPANFMYLDLTAGQTVSYAHYLSRPLQLFPGDELGINIDGYTSSQALRLYIDVAEEEIR